MLDQSASGATAQTTANSNGSSTTTIDYSDGSSISVTSAPSSTGTSGSTTSSDSSTGTADNSSIAGTANVFGSNLLEKLIQMQAQLINTTSPQSIATA